MYAEAKKAANIWEIDLATVDFVTYGSDEPLGAGAFGVVRKARWLGADVAVKEITSAKSQGMDDTVARQKDISEDFLKEADVMKALQHPNIVHFYGIGHRHDHFDIILGPSLAHSSAMYHHPHAA